MTATKWIWALPALLLTSCIYTGDQNVIRNMKGERITDPAYTIICSDASGEKVMGYHPAASTTEYLIPLTGDVEVTFIDTLTGKVMQKSGSWWAVFERTGGTCEHYPKGYKEQSWPST